MIHQIFHHDWECLFTAVYSIDVHVQVASHCLQQVIHCIVSVLERLLNALDSNSVEFEPFEFRISGNDCIHTSKQPVKTSGEAGAFPLCQPSLHLLTDRRPTAADPR